MKRYLKDYFYYSKSEKRGIFLLSLLVILTFVLPSVYSRFMPTAEPAIDWMKESGVFCVDIPEDSRQKPGEYGKDDEGFSSVRKHNRNFVRQTFPKGQVVVLEINAADSLDFLSLSGVGPWTASSVLRYRAKLGGFYEIEQLLEVKGIDREKLQRWRPGLTVDTTSIIKIPFNTVSFKSLLRHPYCGYAHAKAMIRFREAYGQVSDIEEIKRSCAIPDSLFKKLSHYISID